MARSIPNIFVRFIATIAIFTTMSAAGTRCVAQGKVSSSLVEYAAKLSQKYHATVLIDPSIVVIGDAVPLDSSSGIDAALDSLTAHVPQTRWRRVIQSVVGSPEDDVSSLADAARMIDSVAVQSLWVEDVVRRRSVSLEKDHALPVATSAAAVSSGAKTYLVYSTKHSGGEGSLSSARFLNAQRELRALLESAPNLRAKATESSMLWWKDMEPTALKSLVGKLGAAGNQVWDHVEAGQRESMIQQFFQTAQQAVAEIQAMHGDTGQSAVSVHNYRGDLERIAAVLGTRFHARIVVDPAMFLTVRPEAPVKSPDLHTAIEKLMTPLAGTQWRRVTIRQRLNDPMLDAARLSRFVRACDLKNDGDITLVSTHSSRADVWRRTLRGEPAPIGDGISTVYLLYAASADDSGVPMPPSERLAGLLARQQQAMLQMDSGQFGSAMEHEVQGWQTLAAPSRQASFSLPMMAGLMAVWMPRQAKERAGK